MTETRPSSRIVRRSNRHGAMTRAAVLLGSTLLAIAAIGAPSHAAAKKTVKTTKSKAPAAGLACTTAAATTRSATGGRLDCVKVGTKLQWQPRGSKANPMGWGEPALVVTEYAKWEITVTGFEPDVTAKVLEPDERNLPPRAGAQYVGLYLSLKYVGANDSEMVRQGVNMLGVVGSAKPIERAIAGTGTEDDCWANERVDVGTVKTTCMMPFEVDSAQIPSLLFYAAKVVGTPVVYYSTTPPK